MRNAWFACGIVIVVASAFVAIAGAAEDLLKDVVEVQLIREGGRNQKVTIRDEAGIKKFVSAVTLKEKTPCACDCINFIVFVKADKSEVKLSISDHCLNFNRKCYEMPAELWDLYKKQLEAAASAPAK